MKTYKNYLYILFLGIGTLFMGCSKSESPTVDKENPENMVTLQFQPDAVIEQDNIDIPSLLASNKSQSINYNATNGNYSTHSAGFDVSSTIKSTAFSASSQQGRILHPDNAKASDSKLANSLLQAGVKYTVVMLKTSSYHTDDFTFYKVVHLTMGVIQKVPVQRDAKYMWYVISYNNATAPAVTATNYMDFQPVKNCDILHAVTSTFVRIPTSVNPGSNEIVNLTFKHIKPKVSVNLNTLGMFSKISAIKMSINGGKMRNYNINLLTGKNTSNFTEYNSVYEIADFTPVPNSDNYQKSLDIYTTDIMETGKFQIAINGLQLTSDKGTLRNFDTNLSSQPLVNNFTTAIYTRPESKSVASYAVSLNIVESPVTLAGVKWARQNLYYDAASKQYRFQENQNLTAEVNSYWAYGASLPNVYTTTKRIVDPCSLVYPANKWRLPKTADFNMLTLKVVEQQVDENAGGFVEPTYIGLPFTKNPSNYTRFTGATGIGSPYVNGELQFPFNGAATAETAAGQLTNTQLGTTFGSSGDYWIQDATDNFRNKTALYVFRVGNTFSPIISPKPIEVLSAQDDLLKSGFRNIRCVQN